MSQICCRFSPCPPVFFIHPASIDDVTSYATIAAKQRTAVFIVDGTSSMETGCMENSGGTEMHWHGSPGGGEYEIFFLYLSILFGGDLLLWISLQIPATCEHTLIHFQNMVCIYRATETACVIIPCVIGCGMYGDKKGSIHWHQLVYSIILFLLEKKLQ